VIRENVVYNEDKCISIGRDSHDNKIYDNILSDCLSGVYITKASSNNEVYNNKIENVGYGLVANVGSNNNIFYSNTIEGIQISETFEDADSSGNVLVVR
jgi:parallel beta-helix repeat protein